MKTLITNARLVLHDQVLDDGWLLIDGERILDQGQAQICPQVESNTHVIDAAGNYLLPGLIDLHCDMIEKLVEPRPGVQVDISVALQEADLRLAGCGITTEFHALSLDDNEFGVRSENFFSELTAHVQSVQKRLLVRHKIHARLELTSQHGCEKGIEMMRKGISALVSMMDHSPGQGQYRTEQAFKEYVVRTTHRTPEEVDALIARKRQQIAEKPARIIALSQVARETGIPLAIHDDDTPKLTDQWHSLGVSISEFPTTMEAAQRAHELGVKVCMGAPNVLRGCSSGGNLSALSAIEANAVDALCSDYYPSAMLASAFLLAKKHYMTLPEAVRMVTLHPAQAAGIGHEYGSLEKGKIADLILVDVNEHFQPRVQRVILDGQEHFSIAGVRHLQKGAEAVVL
ncbi:alpha-D-ribose 1-methylphosphonate 5-triphosphate diphosphatase [Ktedonospora formicarum]|uniref:Amidohydrolase n=1 Tax=Ktedonospora formicarum TaxID=2778364 RepID=A0A8J3MPU3_9CHLR|nr:alpha-D-ribose 1-methylphosphonate 5-triphosphate diphosphatase [Ktedonospora formicarum]GHO41953.1 amidohydrolase [Ktedonospora formicarum]